MARLVPHVGFARERRHPGVGHPLRGSEVGWQHFVVERRELLIGVRLARDERARVGQIALGRTQRLRRSRRAVACRCGLRFERVHDERVHRDVDEQRKGERDDERSFLDDDPLQQRHFSPLPPASGR